MRLVGDGATNPVDPTTNSAGPPVCLPPSPHTWNRIQRSLAVGREALTPSYELASGGGRLRPFISGGARQACIWYVASGRDPTDLDAKIERSLGGHCRKVEQVQFHWLQASLYQRE